MKYRHKKIKVESEQFNLIENDARPSYDRRIESAKNKELINKQGDAQMSFRGSFRVTVCLFGMYIKG